MPEMSDTRAQILASFCQKEDGKYPAHPNDLVERVLRTHALARWAAAPNVESDEDLNAGQAFDLAMREEEFEAEAAVMVTEGLLLRPQPHLIGDHEKPPDGVYQLTLRGRTQAFAVLKSVQANEKGG